MCLLPLLTLSPFNVVISEEERSTSIHPLCQNCSLQLSERSLKYRQWFTEGSRCKKSHFLQVEQFNSTENENFNHGCQKLREVICFYYNHFGFYFATEGSFFCKIKIWGFWLNISKYNVFFFWNLDYVCVTWQYISVDFPRFIISYVRNLNVIS